MYQVLGPASVAEPVASDFQFAVNHKNGCLLFSFALLFVFVVFLDPVQVMFERIELACPEFPILLHPCCHCIEVFQPGFTIPFSAFLPNAYQAAFGKNADMFGDRGPAHIKFLCHGIQVQRLPRQQADDFPAGRIGNGLENVSSHVGGICVTNRLHKYKKKPIGYLIFFQEGIIWRCHRYQPVIISSSAVVA